MQPQDKEKRMKKGDKPKFTPFGHPVTINELHAVILGATTGFLGGILFQTTPLVGALYMVGFTSYSILGYPMFESLRHDDPDYEKSIGLRTIKHEPWWFVFPFLLTFITTLL